MINNAFDNLPHTIKPKYLHNKELEWNEAIEQRRLSSAPMLVRVCAINGELNCEDYNIKIGDEFFLTEVSIQHMRLLLKEDYENPEILDKTNVVVPVKAGGRYHACPHYQSSHTFDSVQDMLDVYPFISDLIFPQERLTIEGFDIEAWEILQIVRMVQASPVNQMLEVRIVMKDRHVLLPSSLKIKFLQWNDKWALEDDSVIKKMKPRVYSLLELTEFWSTKLKPMCVKIYDENPSSRTNSISHDTGNKSPFTKIFQKTKKGRKVTGGNTFFSEDEDFWMFPAFWRTQPLIVEPVHIVQITNPHTSAESILSGNMNIQVILVSKNEEECLDRPQTLDLQSQNTSLESSLRQRTSSDAAIPLHELNLMSLRSNKDRSDAIVAVVTSSINSASRQPSSLAFGTWVALHRTRRVRKMLLKSNDSQYFLVTRNYSGEFERLALVFETAGDVPLSESVAYISRCTAYPVQKQLDSCTEGQHVWFTEHSQISLNGNMVKVVECQVSDSIDGPRQSATFPTSLRGRFEKIDNTPLQLTTSELFRMNFPVCIRVERQDPNIGFDPLTIKKSFHVTKMISELTVIVEILKKGDDDVKGTGTLLEIPVKRSSIYLRKAPLKSVDSIRGINRFPMRNDFKGLQKLPCVEMLAESDVSDLQDALRNTATYPMLNINFDKEQETDHSSSQRSSYESPCSPQRVKNPQVTATARKLSSIRKSKSAENLSDVMSGKNISRNQPQRRSCKDIDYESPNKPSSYKDEAPSPAPRQTLKQTSTPKPPIKPKPRIARNYQRTCKIESKNPILKNGVSPEHEQNAERRLSSELFSTNEIVNANVNSENSNNPSQSEILLSQRESSEDAGLLNQEEFDAKEKRLGPNLPIIPPTPIRFELT